jgi:hypothetical protein
MRQHFAHVARRFGALTTPRLLTASGALLLALSAKWQVPFYPAMALKTALAVALARTPPSLASSA